MAAIVGSSAALDLKSSETFRTELVLMILHLAAFRPGTDAARALESMATRHRATPGRLERYVEAFRHALLRTLERYDPEYGPHIASLWIRQLASGLEFMARVV